MLSSETLCLPFWMTMPVEGKQEREKEEEEGEVVVEAVEGGEIRLRHLLLILYQNHRR